MRRFLILEDDPDLRASLCELLLLAGAASCLAVGSVEELQEVEAEALRADVALLDVHLGDDRPSGLDAHAWLLSRGFSGQAVFLTGHGRPEPAAPSPMVLEKPVAAGVLEALAAGEPR